MDFPYDESLLDLYQRLFCGPVKCGLKFIDGDEGLRRGDIIEIYGGPLSCKLDILLQIGVSFALPKTFGGKETSVFLLNITGRSFYAILHQLVESRLSRNTELLPEELEDNIRATMNRIQICRCFTVMDVLSCFEKLRQRVFPDTNNALLLLDDITNLQWREKIPFDVDPTSSHMTTAFTIVYLRLVSELGLISVLTRSLIDNPSGSDYMSQNYLSTIFQRINLRQVTDNEVTVDVYKHMSSHSPKRSSNSPQTRQQAVFRLHRTNVIRMREVIQMIRSIDSTSIKFPLVKRRALKPGRSLTDSNGTEIYLKNYMNTEYVGKLGFGTPLQELSVVFDTGSSDIWVPDSTCTKCGHHDSFDSTKSSSYSPVTSKTGGNKEFTIKYGSGSVSGYVGSDTTWLTSDIPLKNTIFGLTTKEDSAIASFDMDGIVGLAFSGLASVTQPVMLDLLSDTFSDSDLKFDFYLLDSNENSNSYIEFGAPDDDDDNTTNWQYSPVFASYSLRYWTVLIDAIQLSNIENDKVSLSLCDDEDDDNACYAIVDSGTSGIGLPDDVMTSILKSISVTFHDTTCYSCYYSDFPILTFKLDKNVQLKLQPEDYVSCSMWRSCSVSFQSTGSSGFVILGDTVIEAFPTRFDVDNLRVGFLCATDCGSWSGKGGSNSSETIADEYILKILLVFGVIAMVSTVVLVFVRNWQKLKQMMARKFIWMTGVHSDEEEEEDNGSDNRLNMMANGYQGSDA